MSTSSFVFLTVRALHVLVAATWIGTIAFLYFFLVRVFDDAGPAAGPIMAGMVKRGISSLIASLGGLTVLTGIWLYWRFTGGFDPVASATMGARVFGAGGAAGIVALIIGGAIVGRTAKKVAALGAKAAATTEAAERQALAAQITAGKQRMVLFGRIVFVLQAVALVCMAIGHYV
jgi:uncharacterized iron-regulated membrane protein